MWMCSPPLREPADQEALWWALEIGTLQTVSSDHAPYRMDASGKLAKGRAHTSRRSPTACRGSSCACPCCSTRW